MSKNQVQFQKGYSVVEFIKDYGTEEQCSQALFKWRWPDGFRCRVPKAAEAGIEPT